MPHRVPREDLSVAGPVPAALRYAAGIVVSVISVLAWISDPAAADTTASQTPDASRGAYLAAISGCELCHTDSKNNGPAYAGGRLFASPIGSVATPNITPDKATGIGRWSLADFTRAMRWGVAPDDSHYLPLFPFAFYSGLTDGDLADLKAFLDKLPPVARANIQSAEKPFSGARPREIVAILAQPMPAKWVPQPNKSAAWNRGGYLVATVGRCSACHTPPNALGAPDMSRFLAGIPGHPGDKAGIGEKAPNITPDPETGIGKWSEDDILALLKDGQTPDFDFVGGTMGEIVKATGQMSEADRQAIAAYLKEIPALPARPPERK